MESGEYMSGGVHSQYNYGWYPVFVNASAKTVNFWLISSGIDADFPGRLLKGQRGAR